MAARSGQRDSAQGENDFPPFACSLAQCCCGGSQTGPRRGRRRPAESPRGWGGRPLGQRRPGPFPAGFPSVDCPSRRRPQSAAGRLRVTAVLSRGDGNTRGTEPPRRAGGEQRPGGAGASGERRQTALHAGIPRAGQAGSQPRSKTCHGRAGGSPPSPRAVDVDFQAVGTGDNSAVAQAQQWKRPWSPTHTRPGRGAHGLAARGKAPRRGGKGSRPQSQSPPGSWIYRPQPTAPFHSEADPRGDAQGGRASGSPWVDSSAGESQPRHFAPPGRGFEPPPCHPAFSDLFARWLFHAELARMTFPAQLPSCFRLFYQPIQLENGYHLAEKQTEKHIFVSKTLMIGRIAPISA